MERIEDIGFGGLKLIQESESFCYGIDAVILADFAYRTCSSFRTAVDLGTGNGIIPFILSSKNESAHFSAAAASMISDPGSNSCSRTLRSLRRKPSGIAR